MTMKNKETLEKLRTYQIGVIRSVIASRQGRLGTYSADATDRERLADTDGLAYEEYYESPLTIGYDGLCRNVISLEFCEDGLTPVCLMDGGDGFPLPLENLSCDTLQGIVEWLEEYDFIRSAEAAPQTTSDLTANFVERCLPRSVPSRNGLPKSNVKRKKPDLPLKRQKLRKPLNKIHLPTRRRKLKSQLIIISPCVPTCCAGLP